MTRALHIAAAAGAALALALPASALAAALALVWALALHTQAGRKLDLHVDKPDKGYIKRIDVYINGKRVQRLKGKRARKGDIFLRELKGKRGKFKVTVVSHISDGSLVVSKRTYRGCKKTRPTTTIVNPSTSR